MGTTKAAGHLKLVRTDLLSGDETWDKVTKCFLDKPLIL